MRKWELNICGNFWNLEQKISLWTDVVVKYMQFESIIKNIYNRAYTMNMGL